MRILYRKGKFINHARFPGVIRCSDSALDNFKPARDAANIGDDNRDSNCNSGKLKPNIEPLPNPPLSHVILLQNR